MAAHRADPERIQTRNDLARELTVLRSEAGLTVRDLADQVGAPAATLGDYFAGRHLPGPRQTPLYLALLDACGVRDPALVERWTSALTRVRLSWDGRAAKGAAPFRGLDPFGEADAHLFFGRQEAVEDLLAHLRRARDDASEPGSGGAVALVGPSGSGKTSLCMAGLQPAVRAGALDDGEIHWDAIVRNVDQLGSGALPRPSSHSRQLVIVDQTEGLFSLDGTERAALRAALKELQRTSLLVLGLRADFYKTALSEPVLLPALRNQRIMSPMTVAQLRDTIVGPVRQVGAGIEEGLVELILADVAPGGVSDEENEPGSLPLLSYALLATWERAPRNHLTIADYRAVGGLRGAVRSAAESVYAELSGAERLEARRIFSRLVRVDDGGPPTRRRVSREELLTEEQPESGAASAVLERFVTARLLTTDTASIQISHETLLGAWPRLSEWVSSDREWLRAHHQIADAARTWADSDRDEELLWRGSRLGSALDLAVGPGRSKDLNPAERDFLSSSSHHEKDAERLRRRRARRTLRLLGAVAVLAVVAVVLATVAVTADIGANRARDQALSRQVAIEAQQLKPTDPSLAAQLALAAYRISPTTQATSTLLDATAGEIPARILGPVGPTAVAVSPKNVLAVDQSATDTVRLYQLSSKAPVMLAQVRVGPRADPDYAVALSRNGQVLAAGGTTDSVVLWDVADPTRPVRLATLGGLASTVYSLAFTPHDRELAAADDAGVVYTWNVASPSHPSDRVVLHAPGGAVVNAVAYNSAGTDLAAAGDTGLLALWRGGDEVPSVAPGTSATVFESVAFGPGAELAVVSGNHYTVETWSVSEKGRLSLAHGPVHDATTEVGATAFSPDGSTIAVGATDGSLKLYSARTLTPLADFGDPDPVTSVAFTANGRDLVSADSGGVTRIWPLPPPSTDTEPGDVYSLTYSSSGRYLSAGSEGADGDVTVWGGTQTFRPRRLANIPMPPGFGQAVGAAAISPDGDIVAAANFTAAIQLFDISNLKHPTPLGPPLHGNKPIVEQLFFSPDGKLLLAGDNSGQVRVWEVSDPSDPRPLPTIRGAGEIQGIAFSSGTRFLATASTDKLVRLYDIADPRHPKLLSTVGGFAGYAFTTAITPSGRTLVAGSADGTIRLWDISEPSHPKLLGKPLSIPAGYVYQLSISPDGRTLAAASTSDGVWLWNISDPSQPTVIANLTAAQDAVFVVLFSPDDQVLAAAGSDATIHLWYYQPRKAANEICSSVGAAITRAEWNQYVQGAAYRPPCR